MATVIVKEIKRKDYDSDEAYRDARIGAVDVALKQLRKKSINEDIMKITRDKMYYKSKSEKRKEKEKAGRRKQLKKLWREKRFYKD